MTCKALIGRREVVASVVGVCFGGVGFGRVGRVSRM